MARTTDGRNIPLPFSCLPEGTLRLVQISDTHLYAALDGTLLGLNTQQTCDAILGLVREQLLPADLLLVTGDLVHDASDAGYRRLGERLAALGPPVCCLPGNHDDPARMARHYDGNPVQFLGCRLLGDWLLVLLDSVVPRREEGHLARHELERLEAALEAHPDRPALILLHHNPLPLGCEWLDTMSVGNPEALFAIVDRHPQVRALVFGHIHQVYEGRRNGVRLLGCPSSCIQFAPGTLSFALDPIPPGVRWLGLTPDGEIHTGVLRLPEMPAGLLTDSGGYKGQ